jgi:hemoglobin/transferrin/lactoferrin receptor protein
MTDRQRSVLNEGWLKAALAGVSLIALGCADLMAQDQAPAAAPSTQLDEITVTTSRREERAVDALGAVSVTNRQELRRDQPERIGTSISRMPGVTTQENPNDPATSINIRGLQDFGRVAVTVDGARQNFQRSGHNANGAFFLDPAFVRSIDITRGPVANIFGSGAIGGVASFETIRPSDILRPWERYAAEVNGAGTVGRQGGWNGSIIGAMRPVDWFAALAGISYRRSGDFRDGAGLTIADSGQDLRSAIGKVELTPGEGQKLTLAGQYQRYEFANGLGTATNIRRDNEVVTDNFSAKYVISRPDLPWLNLSASAYTTGTDTDQRRISGTPAQIGQQRFFRIRTNGFDIHKTAKFDLGGAKLDITTGFDGFEDKVRTSDPFGNGDETTPGGRRTVFGGFAQAHLSWAQFDLIGAARYDSYRLEGGRNRSDGSRISPKLTIGWRLFDGIQLYGTYAEGYRAPSITETLVDGLHPSPATFVFVPNPALRPEVGRTVEAGLNIKYDDVVVKGDKLRGKVAIFRNDVTDFIDGVYRDPGAPCGSPVPRACLDAFYTYENVARARLTGVEAELTYDARRWFVGVSGSSVRGDNLTTTEPLQSIYPDRIAISGGIRAYEERLTVGGRVTLVDGQKRLPLSALATASKPYTLVDLNASYAFTPDARAFVTLENIGDIRYKRFRDGDYSPGFTAKFGFSTRFGT